MKKDTAKDLLSSLRSELAQEEDALARLSPVLAFMLSGRGKSMVSDEILAHMRGLLSDIARQLIDLADDDNVTEARRQKLEAILSSNSRLVSHCFALSSEQHFTSELAESIRLDPVLSPVLQELIGAKDSNVAELAMATMAAQARFVQTYRRMTLPLGELPADLFGVAMKCWKDSGLAKTAGDAVLIEQDLTARYDESATRLGLLSRLIHALKSDAKACLDLETAGVALFASALSRTTGQPRELAILSCHQQQALRLALGLRANDLPIEGIARQFQLLGQDIELPNEFAAIDPQEAAALLVSAPVGTGG
jgi:hypothetical protein